MEKNERSSAKAVVYTIKHSELPEDEKVELYKKASEYNCETAEYELGNYYRLLKNDDKAYEWHLKGSDKGDVYCIMGALSYNSCVLGCHGYEDREKALELYQLLFSLADTGQGKENDYLSPDLRSLYYYGYAVELDIDKEHRTPDHIHAIHYYRKCLDIADGARFYRKILSIAMGYIDPNFTDGTLDRDISYAKELILLLGEKLDDYLDFVGGDGEKDKAACLGELYNCYRNFVVKTRGRSVFAKKDSSDPVEIRISEQYKKVSGLCKLYGVL